MGDIGYSKRQMRSHTPISTASSSNVFIANGHDLRNNDQYDSQIPTHEDIYDNPSDGIFTNVSYDDEGAVADFTNLETTVNVRAYYSRQSRITLHASIHLKLLEIHLSIHRQGAKYTKIEPKKISQVIKDGSWVDAMQEELLQFKKIQESFVDPKFPKKVYKVIKALYGLHQAFKASYASLSTFLLKSGYRRGTIVKNSFHQRQDRMISVWVQIHDWLFNVPLRGAVLGLILCLHRACINDLDTTRGCACCESAKSSKSWPSKYLDAQAESSQPLIGFGGGLDCQHGNPMWVWGLVIVRFLDVYGESTKVIETSCGVGSLGGKRWRRCTVSLKVWGFGKIGPSWC
ncbi:hypothetical protein Tco_0646685 [Tanacetum coccineum]